MTVLISFVRHRFRARVARFSRNDRDHFVELSDVNENFQFCRKVPKANYLFLVTYVFQLILLQYYSTTETVERPTCNSKTPGSIL